MPRPRLRRRICFEAKATYYKPAGIPLRALEEVVLKKDELEALRLQNLKELDQETAAKQMQISQPTFHRLLVEAKKKITDALINGKAIKIEQ
ncbi:MAG: DUF134 domain-containing protein [Nanoarchaeota archaeon]|nr:DUF134 domain-containing protein [Nanoarchaeota archaeon]MBU0977693.1 DUF134 domain-containing protein [Nanoarchaeota archaeon]